MATESAAVHWEHYAAHGAARSLMAQLTSLDARDTLSIADRLPDLGLPARVGEIRYYAAPEEVGDP